MSNRVIRIRQIQVPVRALGRQHHHANDTTRAAIPLDRLLQRLLHKPHSIGLLHALPPVGVAETVDVCRARTADRVRLLVEGSAEGDAVDLAAVTLVPACDDEAGSGDC